jgi:hypothetical protein
MGPEVWVPVKSWRVRLLQGIVTASVLLTCGWSAPALEASEPLTLGLAGPEMGNDFPIDHAPISCVARDQHAVVNARTRVETSRMQVHFRVPSQTLWYRTAMRQDGADWTAILPRTTAATFEYRIEMASPTLGDSASTPAFSVDVVADLERCQTGFVPSVQTPIIVRVPQGAPLIPPVPAGFSPVGVVGANEAVVPSSSSKGRLVAAAALPMAVVAGIAASSSQESGPKATPVGDVGFKFAGVQPADGYISLSGTRLFWSLDVDHTTRTPVSYGCVLELLADSRSCAFASGFFSASGNDDAIQRVTLSGPLRATCPSDFTATGVRVSVQSLALNSRIVFEATVPARFEVGP